MDITEAAAPRSDQINADDLMPGPRVVTLVETRKGSVEQPVEIVTAEFGPRRPYRPGKSMIRVLINAWGAEASAYAGRRMMIYRDPEISFGSDKVGGIRISHMSDIDKKLTLALTITRGKRKPYVVEPLSDALPVITPEQADDIIASIEAATDRAGLDAVSKELKSFNLGAHRARIGAAGKAKAAELIKVNEPAESGEQA